jgi:hypothetical protein
MKRRTVRHLTYIVESEDLSEREHERRCSWTEKNMQDAGRQIEGAFVSMVFTDENRKVVGIFASGDTPTDEIRKIAEELISGG